MQSGDCLIWVKSSQLRKFEEVGAGGGGRTHTPLRARDFESRASSNSATPAALLAHRSQNRECVNYTCDLGWRQKPLALYYDGVGAKIIGLYFFLEQPSSGER